MIHCVVLEIDLSRAQRPRQTRRLDERRESGVMSDARLALQRQKLVIPPHVRRTRRDVVAPHVGPDAAIVINHLERGPTVLAGGQRR